jgi:hypothetical protein
MYQNINLLDTNIKLYYRKGLFELEMGVSLASLNL